MALTGNYKNIYFIMDRLHQQYGFDDIVLADVAENIWDIMGYIGNPDTFETKHTEITITNFRGVLPTDYYSFDNGTVMEKGSFIPLTNSLDTLSLMGNNTTTSDIDTDAYTYKIVNGYIFVGLEDTTITIQYKAFPIDANNLPLIPSHPKAIRLVVDFVAENLAMKYWMLDKLTKEKFDYINKEALYSRAAFRSSALTMDLNTIERYKNRYLSLLIHPDMYDNNFKYMGSRVNITGGSSTTNEEYLLISTSVVGVFTIILEGEGTVIINWGDGSANSTVDLLGNGAVTTTHTYAAGGTLTITNTSIITSINVDNESLTSFIIPESLNSIISLTLSTNTGLQAIDIPTTLVNLETLTLNGCSLVDVNQILINLDSSGIVSATINLAGGTNVAPTDLGITAAASLVTKGNTVTTN